MISTLDEARRYLLNLLPPGAELLYDLTTSGDVYLIFDGVAQAFLNYGFNLLAKLATEIFPNSAVDKLPDWEADLGISSLNPALYGTTQQRQAALVAKLRESGPWCDPVVASILQPLLGYFPTTTVQIVKCPRAELNTAHTYDGGSLFCGHGSNAFSRKIETHDGGVISQAGVRLSLFLGAPLPTDQITTFSLIGPDGTTKNWLLAGDGVTTGFKLFAPNFAGKQLLGGQQWKLGINNISAATDVTVTDFQFIVEGIGPNQETGGAIFSWGAYADPAHLGENGVPADFGAARAAIARIEHSEADGALILALSSNPDDPTAIPDTFLPV